MGTTIELSSFHKNMNGQTPITRQTSIVINSFFIEKKMLTLTGTVIDVFYNSFSFIIEEILA